MAHDTAVTEGMRPGPHRRRSDITLVLLALFGVPLLWGIRLAANFALASHFCFPGALRRHALPGSLGWLWPSMVGLNGLSILAAIAAAVVSYRALRRSAGEGTGSGAAWTQAREGRTRFLSLWGLLTAALFLLLAAFDLIALWIVPVCG